MSSFHMITASDARPADLMVQIVRFGSFSDFRAVQTDVRFCCDSRRKRPSRSDQLWATTGLIHRGK